VTTEKDVVKLAQFDEVVKQEVPIWAVRIQLTWREGFDEWTRVVLNG